MPKLLQKPTTAEVELTDEQLNAVDTLLSFPKSEQTLGGYAGTGKTTVIKTLVRKLPRFGVAAYTGKAANVLRRKGVPATTIHSRIYRPLETPDDDEDAPDKRKPGRPQFELRDLDEIGVEGFVIDEASMVNREIYDDLKSFGLPLIFVGDHGQLEPVGGGKFNLMRSPDITLETIHRNAGEIAHFAEFIRDGSDPIKWRRNKRCTGKQVRLSKVEDAEWPDQIIVAFNSTRVAFNKLARETMEYPPNKPVVGDWVMCLRNEHWLRVYNGMQGQIVKLDLDNERMTFRADGKDYNVKFFRDQFNNSKTPEYRDPTLQGRLPFDYCYAVTCHKAQGDEWDDVLVIEQRSRWWDNARWCYTAASRARKKLTWVPYEWCGG